MEALILYFVLFFPAITTAPFVAAADTVLVLPFSPARELGRMITHTLPGIALLLYIIFGKDFQKDTSKSLCRKSALIQAVLPGKRDILPFVCALPALVAIGVGVSLMVSHFAALPPPVKIECPASVAGWAAVVFACLGTGYMEEIFFRYYLLSKTETLIQHEPSRVVFSVVLFTVSHIGDGHWGMVNAALAGLLLAVLFLRFRSLHGIALAHAGYNVFVYAMGAL
ncbi:MAG: CPBP family intramembrane metalloprotease [Treponema sp.]|nr:CPBP family intramembrane metalloprotease [Treponema sp.]